MNVTETDRNITSLKPVAQQAVKLFFQECFKENIHVFITETFRSQARQDYLYAQGRTRSGQIVTWTKSSSHSSGLAWDVGATTTNGNKDIYNVAILKKAGKIANKLNITFGGDWTKNVDYPHFEVKSNWTIPKGYSIDNSIVIPTKSNQLVTFKSEPIKDQNKGELTVSQFEQLTKRINELEKELDNKLNKEVTRAVHEAYKTSWKWLIDNGISDGSNPQNFITREQLSLILKRYHDKFVKK